MHTGFGNIKLIACHSPDNVLIKQIDVNVLNALNITVYSKLMGHPGSHFTHSANIHGAPTVCQYLCYVVVIQE